MNTLVNIIGWILCRIYDSITLASSLVRAIKNRRAKQPEMAQDQPEGTITRTETIFAPDGSPSGELQLRMSKGKPRIEFNGVPEDVARTLKTVGVPNPWGAGNIVLEDDNSNAGRFLNAVQVLHKPAADAAQRKTKVVTQ